MNINNRNLIKRIIPLLLIVMMLLSTVSSFAESVIIEEEIIEETILDDEENEDIDEEIIVEENEDDDLEEEAYDDQSNKEEEIQLEGDNQGVEVKAFSLDNFKTSDVNFAQFPLGNTRVNLGEITDHVKSGNILRVVIYNPEAKVTLGDIKIDGKVELVSFSGNSDIENLVKTNNNIEFKQFLKLHKTVNGESEKYKGRAEDEVEIEITLDINEYFGGSTFCCYPPGTMPEGLPEENDDYKHDGFRDIEISLTELNDKDNLENIKDVKVQGLSDENYEIGKESIISLSIPRNHETPKRIVISYVASLADQDNEETEFTTNTTAVVTNDGIRVAIPEAEVLDRHLTEYTVRYVDENGNDLTEPELFVGEVGTKAEIAVNRRLRTRDNRNIIRTVYDVEGNNHQYRSYKYKATLELSENSEDNEIIFRYTPHNRYGHLDLERKDIIGRNAEYTVYHVDRDSNTNIVKPTRYVRKVGIHHNSLINETLDNDILNDINYKYSGIATRKRTDRNHKFTNLSAANRRDGIFENRATNILYDVIFYYDSVAPRVPVEPEAVEGVLEDHLTNYTVNYKDESGNKIMDSDKMVADKGAFVRYRVNHSLGKFNWTPRSQHRANQNIKNIKPLSPYKYQDISNVDGEEISFMYRGRRNASYIDKSKTENLYNKTTVRHVDVDTKKDIVDSTEYKMMGKSYMSNKALSNKNQSKIGYKLVNLKRIDHRGREYSLRSCGRVPTEYRNNCNYDLVFEYEFVGGKGPETEGPGWINPNATEEEIKSNSVDVTILPKDPQIMEIKIMDVFKNDVFAEDKFEKFDNKEIYPGDILEITEDFKIKGNKIKDIIEDKKLDLISKLPMKFEVSENKDENTIIIDVVDEPEGELTNYTIRHVYEDEDGEYVDIIDRRVGQDKIGNMIRVKYEKFDNYELIGKEEQRMILEEDPKDNIMIFLYKGEGEEPNPEGRYGSYIINYYYEDKYEEGEKEKVIDSTKYDKIVPGVIVSRHDTFLGPEELVTTKNRREIVIEIGKTQELDVLYTRPIKTNMMTNMAIRLVTLDEDGFDREIRRPLILNGRGSTTIDWDERGLTEIKEGDKTYVIRDIFWKTRFEFREKLQGSTTKVYYDLKE